jgi:hypothetical protein
MRRSSQFIGIYLAARHRLPNIQSRGRPCESGPPTGKVMDDNSAERGQFGEAPWVAAEVETFDAPIS